MRLQNLALVSARVAIANEKASEDLSALLEKWFTKHLVKGIKLAMLQATMTPGPSPHSPTASLRVTRRT